MLADGDVLVLQRDGKGIRMRQDSLRPAAAAIAAKSAPKQAGRPSRGEVSTRKRIAEAGSVSVITPVPRTASDILGPPPGHDLPASTPPEGPRARDKWVTASIDRNAAAVIADVFAEADRRDPGHQAAWIALVDGNKDQIARIRAEAAARNITVPIIIDIIHVSEYLWRAAWCFHLEASPDAGTWVLEQLHAILAGGDADVAAAITARAAATPLSKTKAATAARTAGDLRNKAGCLDYPTALEAGWPIATGIIEGACRHLIKDRMDITGARWSTPGAEAILQLRAIITNNDWRPALGLAQPPATPPHLPRQPHLLATSPPNPHSRGNAPVGHRWRRAGVGLGGSSTPEPCQCSACRRSPRGVWWGIARLRPPSLSSIGSIFAGRCWAGGMGPVKPPGAAGCLVGASGRCGGGSRLLPPLGPARTRR